MKYICTDAHPLSYRIFSEFESHADIARQTPGNVTSAGFVKVSNDGTVSAYGYSESLGVGADHATDSQMLNMMFNESL